MNPTYSFTAKDYLKWKLEVQGSDYPSGVLSLLEDFFLSGLLYASQQFNMPQNFYQWLDEQKFNRANLEASRGEVHSIEDALNG